jgi:hypothetical protein
MRKRAVVLAACLAAALLAPASGDAYKVGGRPWPTSTITYFTSARAYSGVVDRAAHILNRTRVGFRLRRSSQGNADVIVAYGGSPCEGRALVGFQRWRTDVLTLGGGCSRALVTLTAAHEFGHVLGLDHEMTRCARMNPTFDGSGTPTRCRRHSLRYWLSHPLTADDVRGLRAIYGD